MSCTCYILQVKLICIVIGQNLQSEAPICVVEGLFVNNFIAALVQKCTIITMTHKYSWSLLIGTHLKGIFC